MSESAGDDSQAWLGLQGSPRPLRAGREISHTGWTRAGRLGGVDQAQRGASFAIHCSIKGSIHTLNIAWKGFTPTRLEVDGISSFVTLCNHPPWTGHCARSPETVAEKSNKALTSGNFFVGWSPSQQFSPTVILSFGKRRFIEILLHK